MDDEKRVTVWVCMKCYARIRADVPMFDQRGRSARHRGECGGAMTWRGDYALAASFEGDPSRRPTNAEARRIALPLEVFKPSACRRRSRRGEDGTQGRPRAPSAPPSLATTP